MTNNQNIWIDTPITIIGITGFQMSDFNALFKNVKLTPDEIGYFTSDAIECTTKLIYPSVYEYYKSNETQYCLNKYTSPHHRRIMKSGLSKILAYYNIKPYVHETKVF